MALITLTSGSNTVAVIMASIDQPLTGVWSADLVLDQIGSDALNTGDSVTIQTDDKAWQLTGTVVPDRNASFLDAVHVRILGGAAGMATPASAKAYQKAVVNDVIKQLMSDSGETLDTSTSDQSFLTTQLPNWSVFGDNTTTSAIVNLIEKFSPTCNWRIQNNGKLFIGVESYPAINSNYQFDLLENNPVEGTYVLGVTQPLITPGISIPDIGNVSRVRHEISQGKIRSHIWITLNEDNRTIQNAISNLVNASLPSIDYLALYTADVKSQSSDYLSLDIQPDDSRLPGMSNLPLRIGVAGITMQIQTGCKVLLGWSGGDPSLPYVTTFTGESVMKMVIKTSQELDLGDANPIDAVILGTTFWNNLNTLCTALQTYGDAINTFAQAVVVPTGVLAPAKVTLATAAGAFDAAISAFTSPNYLSNIVKVK